MDQAVDDLFDPLPFLLVFQIKSTPFIGDGVIPAACACAFVAPIGADIPGLFQTAEGGVEGAFLGLELAAGAVFDGLVDLIAVTVVLQQLGQNDRLGMTADDVRCQRHLGSSIP